MTKHSDLRKRVYSYMEKHKDKTKKFIADHFISENVSKSTIYNIIKRREKGFDYIRRVGSGNPAKIFNKGGLLRLKRLTDHKDGISQNKLAAMFKCDQSYICKTLKNQLNIKLRKKTNIPQRTPQQQAEARKKCSALYRKYKNFEWILDDESYFTLSHATINNNDTYYTSDSKLTPATVKYRPRKKYEPKCLVWIAMSAKGLSEPFICPSGMAINQHIYLEECIESKLVPFIKKYHSETNYVFWPDLASSHYADKVLDYLIENSINHVDKVDNPDNLPECRPIEDFWSILKGKVYENNWIAKDIPTLERRIKKCLKEVDQGTILNLIESVTTRINNVRMYEVIEKRS